MTRTFKEVGLEIDVKDVATEAFDGIIEGQNVYALAVFDIEALVDVDKIAEFDSQVVSSDLVHLDSAFFDIVGAQTNEHSIVSLLPAIH
jgi:hypothetical protein